MNKEKPYTVKIDQDTHKRLKSLSARRELPIGKIIEKLVSEDYSLEIWGKETHEKWKTTRKNLEEFCKKWEADIKRNE